MLLRGKGWDGKRCPGTSSLPGSEVRLWIIAAEMFAVPSSVENPGKPLRESLRFEKTPKISESNTARTTPNPRPSGHLS